MTIPKTYKAKDERENNDISNRRKRRKRKVTFINDNSRQFKLRQRQFPTYKSNKKQVIGFLVKQQTPEQSTSSRPRNKPPEKLE
jgi:hypothetical protein